MDWGVVFTSLFSAGVGGGIAGYYSMKAIDKSHEHQKKTNEDNEAKLIASLLQSIHDEVESVHDRYQETMGNQVEVLAKDTALTVFYPVLSDFFSVYHGNSLLLGRIDDHDLRKQIIKTYTLMKGLCDSYRLNNELLAKYEFIENLYAETNNPAHHDQAVVRYAQLIEYADSIKSSHSDVKQSVTDLLRELRKAGVLSDKR